MRFLLPLSGSGVRRDRRRDRSAPRRPHPACGADRKAKTTGAARVARLARGLLARHRRSARVPRAVDAAPRRDDARRQPDGREGRDAGLRIPAPRARGRTASSMSRRRPGKAGEPHSGSKARPSTRRRSATTRSSRSSIPGRDFRSRSPIAARRKAGSMRPSRARSAEPSARPPIRCAASTANRASSSRVDRRDAAAFCAREFREAARGGQGRAHCSGFRSATST